MLLASLMGETASRARKRIQRFSESEYRDSGEEGEVETLARYSISLPIAGSVSDQWAATGGWWTAQKKAKTNRLNHFRVAGAIGVAHGFRMRHDKQVKTIPARLGISEAVSATKAFGLAARVGERVEERTEQKAKWSDGFGNLQGINPQGERKSAGFQGVVFQGESKTRSLGWRAYPVKILRLMFLLCLLCWFCLSFMHIKADEDLVYTVTRDVAERKRQSMVRHGARSGLYLLGSHYPRRWLMACAKDFATAT
jgi:hypothetical protein